jgi:drug/metabolite transporter (DMT)-like permease
MNNTNKNTTEGFILVLICGICWGLMGVMTQALSNLGFDAFEISTFRPAVAAIFYVIYSFITDRSVFKIDLKGLLFFAFYGIVTLDGMFLSFTYSVEYANIATASVLLYINPIFVMILSYFLFSEKMTWNKVLAIIIAMTGVFLLSKGYNPSAFKLSLVGIVAGAISGLMVALQNVFGKWGVNRYPYKTQLVYSFLFAAVFMMFIRPPSVVLPKIDSGMDILMILAIGIIGTVIPNGTFLKALQHIEATKASIIISVEPIVASIMAYLLLKKL